MLVLGLRAHRTRPPESTLAEARQLRGADTRRFADGVDALAMERKHN
ncbi:MAG TPA: hypothetical protein VMS21_05190 [Methylomirabilota bacterium]|nr:hypothetical protein [Methylomirabilota bacterium]